MRRYRPRALVVDDVADAADPRATLLRLWGYDAKACYGGVAALELAPGYHPHGVLLDVGVPGVDGFRLARGLREMPGLEGIVLIGISGHADKVCRTRARATGFDHYLIKPADPVRLQGWLARAVPPGRRSGGAERLTRLGGNRVPSVQDEVSDKHPLPELAPERMGGMPVSLPSLERRTGE